MDKIRLHDGPQHDELTDEVPAGYRLVRDAAGGTLGRIAVWTGQGSQQLPAQAPLD